jgi:hypothetical protein
MANCYFAEPHGMKHCYIPFFILLISNALLVLARHTTLGSRVHVQTVGLNAETEKVSAPSSRVDFSLLYLDDNVPFCPR